MITFKQQINTLPLKQPIKLQIQTQAAAFWCFKQCSALQAYDKNEMEILPSFLAALFCGKGLNGKGWCRQGRDRGGCCCCLRGSRVEGVERLKRGVGSAGGEWVVRLQRFMTMHQHALYEKRLYEKKRQENMDSSSGGSNGSSNIGGSRSEGNSYSHSNSNRNSEGERRRGREMEEAPRPFTAPTTYTHNYHNRAPGNTIKSMAPGDSSASSRLGGKGGGQEEKRASGSPPPSSFPSSPPPSLRPSSSPPFHISPQRRLPPLQPPPSLHSPLSEKVSKATQSLDLLRSAPSVVHL